MKTCVFAGTFDPITLGHQNVIQKCLEKYQKVLVVVGQNPNKTTFFTESQRLRMVEKTFENQENVQVVAYSSLKDEYAEFLKSQNVTVYVRGIRNQNDLEFERLMEQKNKEIYPFIVTEYEYCDEQFASISSTLVRDAIKNGADYNKFVPQGVATIIADFLQK